MAVCSTREEEYPTKEMTALTVLLSLRDSPNSVAPSTQVTAAKTFREIFCSNFAPEAVAASPSPMTTLESAHTPKNSESKVIAEFKPSESMIPIMVPNNAQNTRAEPCAQILEKSGRPRVNVKKEEAKQNVAEQRPKTLKDSRWAKEDLPSVYTKIDRKKPNRNATKPRPNTPKEPRSAKIESLHDPLRVQMDMEEFKKDVAEYGLKTLKDSRWAD